MVLREKIAHEQRKNAQLEIRNLQLRAEREGLFRAVSELTKNTDFSLKQYMLGHHDLMEFAFFSIAITLMVLIFMPKVRQEKQEVNHIPTKKDWEMINIVPTENVCRNKEEQEKKQMGAQTEETQNSE